MLAVHYSTNTHNVQSRASVPFHYHGCLKGNLIMIGYPGFGAAGQPGGNGATGLPGQNNDGKDKNCDIITPHILNMWYPGRQGGKGGSGGNAGIAILMVSMAILECQLWRQYIRMSASYLQSLLSLIW